MSFLSKLFGNKMSEKRVLRQPKPLKVNLGDVEDWTLESIVESGSPMAVMVQKTGAEGLSGMESATVTPDLARQALKAKQHEQRADSLAHSGKFREAAEEYKRAIELAPYEDEILYMSLGGVLSEIGKHKEALQYYEIALEINPHNEQVTENYAYVKMKAGMR